MLKLLFQKIVITGLIFLSIECSTKGQLSFEEYYKQAQMEIGEKNYQKVIDFLDKAIVINSRADTVLTLKGFCYYQLNEFESAQSAVEKALVINPKNDYAYFLKGNSISQIDIYAQLAEKGVLANKNFGYDSLNGKRIERYLIFINSNGESSIYDNKAGIDDLSKAIELNDREADYFYHRGVLYREIKEYEFALADLNRAIELLPTEAEFYCQRAHLQRDKGNSRLALSDFDKAIAIKEDPTYLVNRGYLRRGFLNDSIGACIDFRRAEELGYLFDEGLKCED